MYFSSFASTISQPFSSDYIKEIVPFTTRILIPSYHILLHGQISENLYNHFIFPLLFLPYNEIKEYKGGTDMIKYSITEKLQIKHPIIQAGMAGGITTPELVAAVSNAGALGTLGAGYLSPEKTREAIRKIKQLTDKAFAVNLFVPEHPVVSQEAIKHSTDLLTAFYQDLGIQEVPPVNELTPSSFHQQIEVLIEEQVPVSSFTFGIPTEEVISALKRESITTIGTATTVQEALANEKQQIDMVVMQGSEAGGHRGSFLKSTEESMIGTMALIPQTVDHVTIPVIAAGGIGDGRGLVASLSLGADAVQIGTAFVTTEESGANPLHKQAIMESTEDKTVLTKAFSGKPARGIRNEFIDKMQGYEHQLPAYPIQNTLTQKMRKEAAKQNRPEYLALWSGQNPRSSTSKSAGELIQAIISQREDIVKKLKS